MIRRHFGFAKNVCAPTSISLSACYFSSARFCISVPIDRYTLGMHRVPKHPDNAPDCLPQGAWVLDSKVAANHASDSAALSSSSSPYQLAHPSETILDVTDLELDSTSMKQVRDAASTPEDVCNSIKSIIDKRGKMHNPVTRSGGVLIGTVRQIGSEAPQREGIAVGSRVVPLVSMSAIPLTVDHVARTHGNQAEVKGTAVVFSRMMLAACPEGLDSRLVLACLDGSRLLPQVRALFDEAAKLGTTIDSVVVVGSGAAGLAALALTKQLLEKQPPLPSGTSRRLLVGLDADARAVQWAEKVMTDDQGMGSGSSAVRCVGMITDARSCVDAIELRNGLLGGRGADLVLNCVSVAGTEAASTILCRERGTCVYFSMATNFSACVLSTDPCGIDMRVLCGAGVFASAPQEAFALLRNYGLFSYFCVARGIASYMPDRLRDFRNTHMVAFAKKFMAPLPKLHDNNNDNNDNNNNAVINSFEAEWRSSPHAFYARLHRESVQDVGTFWSALYDFVGFIGEKGRAPYFVPAPEDALSTLANARFFPETTCNYAENVLRYGELEPNREALIECAELDYQPARHVTFGQLRQMVASAQAELVARGVTKGDRVAGLLPNSVAAVAFMLATTSLGAVWACLSPDTGAKIAIDRIGPALAPRVIVAVREYRYNNKTHSCEPTVNALMESLNTNPGAASLIYTTYLLDNSGNQQQRQDFDVFAANANSPTKKPLAFTRVSFNAPVLILFTSGTTGKPKMLALGCGLLLNHVKEHLLHLDVGGVAGGARSAEQTVALLFTTTAWMVHSWMVSMLFSGVTLVLVDGSPFPPGRPLALWDLAARYNVNYLGAGAKFYEHSTEVARLQEVFSPHAADNKDERYAALRKSLRLLSSTGSPLAEKTARTLMEWLPGMRMNSLSGGTELSGCLAIGAPALPIDGAALQCAPLGMDVDVATGELDAASSAPSFFKSNLLPRRVVNETAELVCFNSFPSMPLYFFGERDGARYRAAYFEALGPRVWAHGDLAVRLPNGAFFIRGRSDATLKPGGVRCGTSEFYALFKQLGDVVTDSVLVDVDNVGIVMFYYATPEQRSVCAPEEVAARIRALVRSQLSPKHVPAEIRAVDQPIPFNRNLKKMEVLVKMIVNKVPEAKWAPMLPNLIDVATIEPYKRFRDQERK